MMLESNRLSAPSDGKLDPADQHLRLFGGTDPVISILPEGAWTHMIIEKVM